MIIFCIVAGWIVCGVISAGIDLADFEGDYPPQSYLEHRNNLGSAYLFGCGGPITMLLGFSCLDFVSTDGG